MTSGGRLGAPEVIARGSPEALDLDVKVKV
jgi:hypothetical protein